MSTEILLYPTYVYSFNEPGATRDTPVRIRNESCDNRVIGELMTHEIAAPGTGYRTYRITRITDAGVYARLVRDRSRELTKADVR